MSEGGAPDLSVRRLACGIGIVLLILSGMMVPALREGRAQSAWGRLTLLDSEGKAVQKMAPGSEYSIIVHLENVLSSEIGSVAIALQGPLQPASLPRSLSLSWSSSAGFLEPQGQGALVAQRCTFSSESQTIHEWRFTFRLPRLSTAGMWTVGCQTAPRSIQASISAEVGFDFLIRSPPDLSFSVPAGQTGPGSPSPLVLSLACNDQARLYLSSGGLTGASGSSIPASSIIVDDDSTLGEKPETGQASFVVGTTPLPYLTLPAGPERSLSIYAFLSCPPGMQGGSTFSGSLNVVLAPNYRSDQTAPSVENLFLVSSGASDLYGPTNSIVAAATISEDYALSSLTFSVRVDSGAAIYRQIAWTGNGNYQCEFQVQANPGQQVALTVEAIDIAGRRSTATKAAVVKEQGISGVYVGDLSVWENDYFDDLYDIYPSFPSDGWASIYARVASTSGVMLHFERRYRGLAHVFATESVSMAPVSSPKWPNMWEARIRVAPSEEVTYWVTTSEGQASAPKSFVALPDVWNDHYGFGLLQSWGEQGWSPEVLLSKLEEVAGSFVIPINTWGQSSTNPPRYFYPFQDRVGLWEPEFGGTMQMMAWYEQWRRAVEQRDPAGAFYAMSWFFYHRTWRDDAPPVPAPHSGEQWDRVAQKLGRLVATDPTWRALVLDQEYASYNEVKNMVPLASEWDDNRDGVMDANEFEAHMVNDMLGLLRLFRADTWYGGQPHLGYRWSSRIIPPEARLSGSVNHFQHCDANGQATWYFTDHFDSSLHQPLLSAGVSACASDLATDYYLHRTMDRHGTSTDWNLGFAEQVLYAYLLNPHYVTVWVHGGWDGPAEPDSPYSFDQTEKAFAQKIASKWNYVTYLSNLEYAELPTGGSRPFGRRVLGTKPTWFLPQTSDVYYSLSKETGSMWLMAISNFETSAKTLRITIGPELFDWYGCDNLVAIDPTAPGAPWQYLTRSNNQISLTISAQDVRILKVGVPVEVLALPQNEDGYPEDILGKVQPPRFLGYNPTTNEVSLVMDGGVSQFLKLYLPAGISSGMIVVNGRKMTCALQVPNTASRSKTDDVTALVTYVDASNHPPPDGGFPAPKDYVENQLKPYGGYGPFGIPQKLKSSYYWNSFAVMAGTIVGASFPSELDQILRTDCPSSGDDVRKIDLIVSALDLLRAQQPPGIATVLQNAQNRNVPDRDYNNGIEWEYRRVHALTILGQIPVDRSAIVSRVVASQDPVTGGWEADPIGQNLAVLQGYVPQKPCIWRTHRAVIILSCLGADIPQRSKVTGYVSSCQNGDGGWGYSSGRPSDVYPTWCAVQTLSKLGVAVPNRDKVIAFVESLMNSDGGFGDRPGWYSRLESTFYALDILNVLGSSVPYYFGDVPSEPSWYGDSSYKIFSATFEFFNGNYGRDSPSEAAIYAHKMGLDIVAPKFGGSEMAEKFNSFAQLYGLRTMSVVSSENYGFKLQFNGHHWVDHSGEEAYPVGRQGAAFPYSSGTTMGTSFEQFASSNSGFLQYGLLWWNSLDWKTYHLTQDVLDGAVDIGGYNALWCQGIYGSSVPEDNPWVEKYMGHLAPVTECDNHGWAFRGASLAESGKTLFIARSGDWAGLKDAVDNQRTAYVNSQGQIWGDRWAVEYLRVHSDRWSITKTPPVIVVPVTKNNSWEWGGRGLSWEVWKGSGAVVRILAQDGTTPGDPLNTEVYECRIDGIRQNLTFVSAEQIGRELGIEAKYVHSYYYVERPDLLPGTHTIHVDYRGQGGTRVTEAVTITVV